MCGVNLIGLLCSLFLAGLGHKQGPVRVAVGAVRLSNQATTHCSLSPNLVHEGRHCQTRGPIECCWLRVRVFAEFLPVAPELNAVVAVQVAVMQACMTINMSILGLCMLVKCKRAVPLSCHTTQCLLPTCYTNVSNPRYFK